ncbi:MAG: heavy metal sensor histidine kinase [Pseudomonas sp.]|uniref:heavy metal sensor histidine kinase n=1 Tax=Pseudomonas sp. TaxID=306 RepID=UPI003BB78CA0
MKPPSLSLRLGLSVGLMGAGLVILLAALAYFALTHELDAQAQKNLDGKLEQLQYHLANDISTADIAQSPHALLDPVMGHDNLNLTIYPLEANAPALLSVGAKSFELPLKTIYASETTRYQRWLDREGNAFLTAAKLLRLKDGGQVRVLLSINRSDDATLLSAYLKSMLIAVPMLLILIAIGAWWIVQRGLAPLRQFRTVAALVSTQDLSHRLAVDKLPQELSDLAHGINFMLHRLDSGVRKLSEFSDDLAHELRSPITNLMCKAQVTLSRERPPEAYKAVLESCTEELERVSRIVSDMLFLAHVSHPAALVPFAKIALDTEARRVIELFSMSAEEKHISLSISGAGSVLGDRLMIQRAISNLLSNALRHSPIGSTISILIETHGEQVSLSVVNPGIGIPAQHLPHLFERFYRVDQSRSRSAGSTGLGLAIVRSIMSLHQGTVEVSSQPAGVTSFRLSFPRLSSVAVV